MKPKYRYGVRWTQQEKEYLAEVWGLISDRHIARRLGRKVSAIRWMAADMGLHRNQSFLNASEVARMFGVNVIVPIRWIELGLLKAKKNGKYWQIDEGDLDKFMRAHPTRYDVRKINAEEYPYVYKMARRFTERVAHVHKAWTPDEDAYLLNHNHRLSLDQLAAKLRRSRKSVAIRLTRLRANNHMLPRRERYWLGRRWSQSEIEYLRKAWGQEAPETIAAALTRNTPGVVGKAKRIGLSSKGAAVAEKKAA